MTANRNFKRRVRDRSRRTGESYTAALRHLRQIDLRERPMTWQRIEKSDFGYAIHVPHGWDERQPNLKNSPWETARFGQTTDRRHSIIMFRRPVRPGRSAADIAEAVQETLREAGFEDFQVSGAEVAGRSGARLDCLRRDAGRVWAVREYFVVTEDVSFCLGCGTAVPDEDDHLFTEVAERLELLDLD